MPPEGRHARLWEWFEVLTPNIRPRPRAEFWPRGGAKSSTAELGAVRLGTRMVEFDSETRPARRFVLYVSGTQDQANQHVETIRQKFEDLQVGRHVGKYGNSKGWKVDLLRTDTGFNVLALGLDAAARGVKLDDFRPDLIILDDVDGRHDTPATVEKKIKTITESILPAGSTDCAILFIQNLIHEGSIASQLESGTADFLLTREQFPAEPAVRNIKYEQREQEDGTLRYVITEGAPTWEGQNLETCEQQLNDWGRAAFEREALHVTDASEDGLWSRERDIDPHRITRAQLPELERIVVGVDPPGETGQCGIVVAGRARIKSILHSYTLEDASTSYGASPGEWAKAVIDVAKRWAVDAVVVETNFGGSMVKHTIKQTSGGENLKIIEVRASRGKIVRAEPIQGIAEEGRDHHVGVFVQLEKEKCSYKAGDKSPNILDADVWAKTELMLNGNGITVDDSAWQLLNSL